MKHRPRILLVTSRDDIEALVQEFAGPLLDVQRFSSAQEAGDALFRAFFRVSGQAFVAKFRSAQHTAYFGTILDLTAGPGSVMAPYLRVWEQTLRANLPVVAFTLAKERPFMDDPATSYLVRDRGMTIRFITEQGIAHTMDDAVKEIEARWRNDRRTGRAPV